MEKRNVRIQIRTEQSVQGERDVTEYEYQGTWTQRNGVCYVSYEEILEEEGGQEPGAGSCGGSHSGSSRSGDTTRTLVAYSAKSMTMTRKGPGRQRMEFVPGERTGAVYETPMGQLPMEVLTRRFSYGGADDASHEIGLEYQLFSGEVPFSEYCLQMRVEFLE